jgi:hypothetical protein
MVYGEDYALSLGQGHDLGPSALSNF